MGFQAEAQNYVNQAIFDIYTFEDVKWPFLWGTTTLNTVVGQTDYTRADSYTALDWNTFRILRGSATASSLTQTGGVATFVASSAHNFVTGDVVLITGANQSDYNISATITVTNSTTFTYPVNNNPTSPATGTIKALSEQVLQKSLPLKSWDFYKDQFYWDTDQNTDPTGYSTPQFVVRKPDNNITISGPCDRVYTIYYEGYSIPAAMAIYTDTHVIPVAFEQVIIDKAMHYAYMFRDNLEQATLAQKRYEDNINKMRRILIPQQTFVIASD